MAANGSSGNGSSWWRALVSPPFLLTLVLLLVGGAAAWTRVDAHTRDCNVHHTRAELDGTYTQRELHDEQMAGIEKRLDRIEGKIDRLSERVGGQ